MCFINFYSNSFRWPMHGGTRSDLLENPCDTVSRTTTEANRHDRWRSASSFPQINNTIREQTFTLLNYNQYFLQSTKFFLFASLFSYTHSWFLDTSKLEYRASGLILKCSERSLYIYIKNSLFRICLFFSRFSKMESVAAKVYSISRLTNFPGRADFLAFKRFSFSSHKNLFIRFIIQQ